MIEFTFYTVYFLLIIYSFVILITTSCTFNDIYFNIFHFVFIFPLVFALMYVIGSVYEPDMFISLTNVFSAAGVALQKEIFAFH